MSEIYTHFGEAVHQKHKHDWQKDAYRPEQHGSAQNQYEKTACIPWNNFRFAGSLTIIDGDVRNCILIAMHRQRDGGRPTELIGKNGEVLHHHLTPECAQSTI